jgi:hypothetical protein
MVLSKWVGYQCFECFNQPFFGGGVGVITSQFFYAYYVYYESVMFL